MQVPHSSDETFDLELNAQDELGRRLAPSQDSSAQDDFSLPGPRPSMRCSSTDRELFKHDFSKDC